MDSLMVLAVSLIFFFMLLHPLGIDAAYPNVEAGALTKFKDKLDDPRQQLTGWGESDDPCQWIRVRCSESRVIELNLGNASLSGPLVQDLVNLTQLQKLRGYSNNFNGTIPMELGNLAKLDGFDLSNNSLSGDIPSFQNANNLQILILSNNNLSGEIPSTLASLHNLRYIDVSNNNLSGPIPSFEHLFNSSFDNNPYLCGDIINKTC